MPADSLEEPFPPNGIPVLLTDALQQKSSTSTDTHILLMLDQFPPVLGGGERVVLRTAALLRDAGYRVSILTFAVECSGETLAHAACPIYLLPITGVFQPAALRAAWQLGRFLRRERVRVVQTYFESSNLFGGLTTKLLSRARLVWNFRDMGILRESKHRAAYRLLRRLPDHVIAVSEKVRRHAIQVDGIPSARVSVMYNGLNSRTWQGTSPGGTGGTPLVMTVGNIRQVKGHDTLIEAAALVLKTMPEVRFQIAGEVLDRPYFEKMQARIASLGVTGSVDFLGKVDDPSPLLRRATLFVLPSRSEGFSNAIIEAMAASLPVIATSVGGNDEAVVNGITGLIVPPDHPQALAAALLHLLGAPELRTSMGLAAVERVERLFTEEAMLSRFRELYQQLCS